MLVKICKKIEKNHKKRGKNDKFRKIKQYFTFR